MPARAPNHDNVAFTKAITDMKAITLTAIPAMIPIEVEAPDEKASIAFL